MALFMMEMAASNAVFRINEPNREQLMMVAEKWKKEVNRLQIQVTTLQNEVGNLSSQRGKLMHHCRY
jgi:hypothetical protein